MRNSERDRTLGTTELLQQGSRQDTPNSKTESQRTLVCKEVLSAAMVTVHGKSFLPPEACPSASSEIALRYLFFGFVLFCFVLR